MMKHPQARDINKKAPPPPSIVVASELLAPARSDSRVSPPIKFRDNTNQQLLRNGGGLELSMENSSASYSRIRHQLPILQKKWYIKHKVQISSKWWCVHPTKVCKRAGHFWTHSWYNWCCGVWNWRIFYTYSPSKQETKVGRRCTSISTAALLQ